MQVLLLRVTGEPHAFISVRRALALLQNGKAYLVEAHETPVRSAGGRTFERPRVMTLTRYLRLPHHRIRWSKRDVLARDNHTCAYCGRPAYTVDHVYPQHLCRAEGRNPNTWENTVAACEPCQTRKGGRTLHESGLAFRPGFAPTAPRALSPKLLHRANQYSGEYAKQKDS